MFRYQNSFETWKYWNQLNITKNKKIKINERKVKYKRKYISILNKAYFEKIDKNNLNFWIQIKWNICRKIKNLSKIEQKIYIIYENFVFDIF